MMDMQTMPDKPKPRLCLDLEDYPKMDYDVGETCELKIHAKVVGRRQDQYSNTVELEVISVVDASSEDKPISVQNDADRALEKMKRGR